MLPSLFPHVSGSLTGPVGHSAVRGGRKLIVESTAQASRPVVESTTDFDQQSPVALVLPPRVCAGETRVAIVLVSDNGYQNW